MLAVFMWLLKADMADERRFVTCWVKWIEI